MEPEDVPLITEWLNNIGFQGMYTPLMQNSKEEMKSRFSDVNRDDKEFIIEKKDGTKIGLVTYFMVKGGPYNFLEIGYYMILSERKKGYCTEAVKLFIDYLFLSQALERIQATTDSRNIASRRVLEKVGFREEGIIRKALFMRGSYVDISLFSILRDEWNEAKILKL